MTLSPFFDVPVFWPILLIYFITLFAITMRAQIAHMIKYNYVPFLDVFSKAQYKKQKKPESSERPLPQNAAGAGPLFNAAHVK